MFLVVLVIEIGISLGCVSYSGFCVILYFFCCMNILEFSCRVFMLM